LFFLAVAGCSWLSSPEHGRIKKDRPVQASTGNYLADVAWIAREIETLSVSGRTRVVVQGKRLPWIRSGIFWKGNYGRNETAVRISGRAVFGINVFDGLVLPDGMFLYVPSHDSVYYAGKGDVWRGYHIDDINTIVSLALVPWRCALMPDASLVNNASPRFPCSKYGLDSSEIFHIRFSTGHGYGVASFRKDNLALLRIVFDNLLSVSCSGQRIHGVGDHSYIPFPAETSIVFRKYHLRIDIRIHSCNINVLSDDATMLEPAPFYSYTFQPLEVLLDSVVQD
jgi:hypothetical protein